MKSKLDDNIKVVLNYIK